MKLTGEEDEAQQNVKRAVQLVLKTARQGVVPLCKEIARMVKENYEMKEKATEFEKKFVKATQGWGHHTRKLFKSNEVKSRSLVQKTVFRKF